MKLCGMTLLYRDIRNSGKKMPIDESVRRLAGVGFEYADLNLVMICNKTLRLHDDNWQKEAEKRYAPSGWGRYATSAATCQ